MLVKHKKHRLFFALWPSPQVRASIVETAHPVLHELTGRLIPPEQLHITLHFIGSVTDETRICMDRAARCIKTKPFSITLSHFNFFSRAKVFYMGCNAIPTELRHLHQTLGEALGDCSYQQDEPEYTPHVSLLRKLKARQVESFKFSINWQVDEFVLVESSGTANGVGYNIIETYPL